MSLQVWLPMTKDLRQQGLSDVTVTNNGATFNSTGKLGGCYQFGTATSYLELEHTFFKEHTGPFSFALWVKIISWNTSYATIFMMHKNAYTWEGGICGLVRNGSSSKLIFQISNGSSYNNRTQTTDLELNKWYHICCTYNGSKLCLYQDGILISSNNVTIVPAFNQILGVLLGKHYNTYQSNCALNDFRFYDHCLSPMEVKQISQGLVLHYPLNREGWGQENLATQYVVPGSNAPLVTTTSNGRTTYYGKYGIIIPATENADTYFSIYLKQALESGKTYTLSCKVSGLLNGTYYNFPLFAQSNSSMGLLKLDHNGLCSLTFTMNYTGTVATSTVNGVTLYKLFMDDTSRTIVSGQGAITITNIKLEEGEVVTPWCPNSSDTLATTMDLNGTTEYDTSGFGNNGTRTGTFSWTSDTPRYNVSTKFNTNYIERSNVINNPSTTAFWIKFDSLSNQIVFTDYNTVASLGIYNNNLLIGYGADCKLTYPKTIITTDKWYHVCIVKSSNTTAEFYLDGILQTPGSTTDYWTKVGTNSQIGARSTNYYFKGNLSDFRIYATALSADDVSALYENSAYISSNATTYAHEFVEV